MNRVELTKLYQDFLAEEGYVPKIDPDGDVAFKYEGGHYVMIIDEEDPTFVRIVYPNFWSIESEEERERVAVASLHATAKTKVAKVFPVKDNTWASIELFCSPTNQFKSVFTRCLGALRAGVSNFREKMHETS